MKNKIFTSLLSTLVMIVFAQGAFAQGIFAIFGQVTDANNNAVANHDVTIVADSNSTGFFYVNTVTTGPNGYYGDTIVGFGPGNMVFYVTTQDCNGGYLNQTVTNNQGMLGSATADFQLCAGNPSPCTASFNLSASGGVITGTNTSTGAASSTWAVVPTSGAVMYSSNTNLSYTAQSNGVYWVCLTTYDAQQNFCDSICQSVTVSGVGSGNCQADFSAFPDSVNTNSFYFADASTGSPTSWSWDFGDNSFSSMQYPSHTYNSPGWYAVCLTISDGVNCTSTTCDSVYVSGGGSSCNAGWYNTQQGLTADFWNTSSGSNLSYSWDFGDGSTSTLANPSHAYAQGGTYTVCLDISDPSGCSDSYCGSVTVAVGNCDAAFTYTVNGLDLNFVGMQSSAGLYNSWYFGDGNSDWTLSHLMNHTYAQGGTYTVIHSVYDSISNCFDSSSVTITLGGGNPGTCDVYGSVFAGNNYADAGVVYLIALDSNNAVLSAIDTTTIDSGMYFFSNVPAGNYYVKAALSISSMYFTQYLPTYYGNSLMWSQATQVSACNVFGTWYDIDLLGGTNPAGGPGFIGGFVWQGANKTAGEGDPVEGVQILLLDDQDQPVAFTTSDASGEYSFSNLAYGTYKVWGEVWGLNTTPNITTLDANSEAQNDVNIVIGETEVTTAIGETPAIAPASVGLYPNPMRDNLNVSLEVPQATELTISMFDMVGKQVLLSSERVAAGASVVALNTNELPEGVYMLRIKTTDGTLDISRKLVKTNQ